MTSLLQRLYAAFRPLLFRLPAETAHELGITTLRLVAAVAGGRTIRPDEVLSQQLWGRRFDSPVGLAAGFDKNGLAIDALPLLGFGFAEVGTVTPRPQVGNPRPRLFRHPAAESVQNAMGFNNAGGRALRRRLGRRYPLDLPLGVNIGKNKDTPEASAEEDYALLFDAFSALCDYFVVNVSSPNTPGLRDLQNETFLARVLNLGRELTDRPILVKISPDMADAQAVDLAVAAVAGGAAGLVIANTTTDYALLPGVEPRGGLSGAVLTRRSREQLAAVARGLDGSDAVLVSVGGISTPQEAYRRIRLGASLLQIYTAIVFHGPTIASDLSRGLAELLRRDGVKRLEDVRGADL